MALQIRRGVNSLRTSINPAEGELLYTTDTKKIFIGDGSTAGGIPVTSLVTDTNAALGSNLNVNGYTITSTSNGDIVLSPNGSGKTNISSDLNITGNISKTGQLAIAPTLGVVFGRDDTLVDGNVIITRNSYSSNFLAGFNYFQHHNTPDAVNFSFYRTRGTSTSPLTIQNNDDIIDLAFIGYDGTLPVGVAGISTIVDGPVSTGKIPGKIAFSVHDGITSYSNGLKLRAEIRSDGSFRIDKLASLSSKDIIMLTDNTLTVGDVRLSQSGLSTVNSNANLTLTSSGTGRIVMAGSVYVTGNSLQLTGISTATRDGMATANGMLIYNSTTNKFQGYENGVWVNLV